MAAPIVVAVDLSEPSRKALALAAKWAARHRAPLVVVHAVQEVPRVPAYGMSLGASHEERARIEQDAEREQLARLEDLVGPFRKQGLEVAVILGHDAPDAMAVAAADECGASFIVVGRHGGSGVRRFVLGSVAQSVLRKASVPVLVVPSA